MCTVSWIYDNDNYICTSNRDEHINRLAATFPVQIKRNGIELTFPQDQQAGGTWYAVSNTGHLGVLLNGAFERHSHQPPYARSRGLVLLEILENKFPVEHFQEMSLKNIEPFTLILHHNTELTEVRWNGVTKYEKALDPKGKYIWSSATLYDKEVIAHREKLFEAFIATQSNFTENKILEFHHYNDNAQFSFILDRLDGLKTVSITQSILGKDKISLSYKDMSDKKITFLEINRQLSLA